MQLWLFLMSQLIWCHPSKGTSTIVYWSIWSCIYFALFSHLFQTIKFKDNIYITNNNELESDWKLLNIQIVIFIVVLLSWVHLFLWLSLMQTKFSFGFNSPVCTALSERFIRTQDLLSSTQTIIQKYNCVAMYPAWTHEQYHLIRKVHPFWN